MRRHLPGIVERCFAHYCMARYESKSIGSHIVMNYIAISEPIGENKSEDRKEYPML